MKILMVSNTYLPVLGGLERSIQLFTEQFRHWGHEVLILVPEIGSRHRRETGVLRVPSFGKLSWRDFTAAHPWMRTAVQKIDRFSPDIIHAHHPFLMGEMALRLSARLSAPLIFTYHILFSKYAHYLPLPTAAARRFLVELSAGYANMAARVISPSESVRKVLHSQGVCRPVDVVPTGVDLSRFGMLTREEKKRLRQSQSIPAHAFVLGYAGRIAPEKNLDFLARTVVRFMKKRPSVHFRVAGQGPSEEAVKGLFLRAGLGGRVSFLGALRGDELLRFYQGLDWFVFASRSETQGMVLCEAMACGIPAAALDGPGVREVLQDGVNGCLLARQDLDAFVSRLEQAETSPERKRLMMGRHARKSISRFALQRCASDALDVYRAALSADPRPSSTRLVRDWLSLKARLRAEWKMTSSLTRAVRLALGEWIGRSLRA